MSEMPPTPETREGWRSYEVYQRMRVRDATTLIKPRQLSGEAYLSDPYPLVAILRENYPCYRDWPGNAFWVTRYDDVTSVFTDTANFESRSRAWSCGVEGWGRDLRTEIIVQSAIAQRADDAAPRIVERLIGEMDARFDAGRPADLATEFCARVPFELFAEMLGVAATDELALWYFDVQRAAGWEPRSREAGAAALRSLTDFIDVQMNNAVPGSLLAVAHEIGATAEDVAITVLEMDHGTLHGSLANTLMLLLTHPEQLESVRANPMLVKASWLEGLRHSPPIVSTDVFARNEVERFGRLLPDGALIRLSAAAANRDPRVFDDPDSFNVNRKDLTMREARGQYRADGLPSAISFGTGAPSKHPAVPEDRPRSVFAQTRDHAVLALRMLLAAFPDMRLANDRASVLRSLRLGEPHTCWSLPVIRQSSLHR
jgi:cytochrome P450